MKEWIKKLRKKLICLWYTGGKCKYRPLYDERIWRRRSKGRSYVRAEVRCNCMYCDKPTRWVRLKNIDSLGATWD
jgi:hypothetical protein